MNAALILPPDEDVDARASQAIEALARLFATDVVAVAWSGGKDSSCTLVLALMALRLAVSRGEVVCPLLVMNGDTEIENPAVRALADDQIERLREWAEAEGLPVRIEVYRPALNATWAVKVLGGMSLPRYAGMGTRDCSVDWKVAPAAKAMRRLLPGLREEFRVELEAMPDNTRLAEISTRLRETTHPVVVLGSRREESAHRADSMERHGQVADQVSEITDEAGKLISRTFSPIAEWEEADVWEVLAYAGTDRGVYPVWMDAEGFGEIVTLYRDAAGGACVVVPGAARPGRTACGARTGCWNCQAVGEDRSLNEMIAEPRHAHLHRLAEIRDFVQAIRWDWSRRYPIGRDLHKETGEIRIGVNNFDDATLEAIALATLSADRAEALRADRFATAVSRGRMPDEAYLKACQERGETPNPGWMRRMAQPAFQTMSVEKVIALDWYWSLYGRFGRPFHAMSLAHRVWDLGEDHRAPVVERTPQSPPPANRWRPLRFHPSQFTGAGDPLQVALEEWINNGEGRQLGNTVAPDCRIGPDFEVDMEAAALVLELEYPTVLKDLHDNPRGSVTDGAAYLLRMGIVRLSPQGLAAAHKIMQRTQALEWSGVLGMDRDTLVNGANEMPGMTPPALTVPNRPAHAGLADLPLFATAAE